MSDELKKLLADQNTAFEEFKKAHAEELKEIKSRGAADPVLTQRLERMEKSMDTAIEAKAAIEAKIDAERKEREELEKRLSRPGQGGGEKGGLELEVKAFNDTLRSEAAEKGRHYHDVDAKGYGEYKSAFEAMLRKNEKLLSADEVKTLSVGSDPDGGYLVTPDMSGRIVKKVYETSPVRQFASVMTISTDALEGTEDLGEAGAGYAGEHSQGSDSTTPQFGRWRIPVHIIDTEPKATQQLLDDSTVDVEAWLSMKVADKFARFENSEFVNGAANRIRGFIGGYSTAADTGAVPWGSLGYIFTGVAGDFASTNPGDKMIDLVAALKNEYLGNSRWFTSRAVITKIRKFKDGQGNYMWQPAFVAGQPETIMGYPVSRMEDMPALATNSLSLAFGDLGQAYQIVDRQGIRVLRDPYTAKPYVKFYTTRRTGGGIVNFEALKLMKFGTS